MVSLENKVCFVLNVERSLLLIRFREELFQVDINNDTSSDKALKLNCRRLHARKVKLVFLYEVCFRHMKINKSK